MSDGTLPYEVEQEYKGCDKCGSEAQWRIVRTSDDVMVGGQTWGDEDEAIAICELMIEAYDQGIADAQTKMKLS